MEHTGSYKSIDIDASLDGFYQYFSLDGFDILKGRANGFGVYGSEIGGFGDYYFVGNFDPEKGEFHALDSIGHAIDFGYSLCNSFLYQEGDKTYLLGMVMEPTQSYEKFRFTMPREISIKDDLLFKKPYSPFYESLGEENIEIDATEIEEDNQEISIRNIQSQKYLRFSINMPQSLNEGFMPNFKMVIESGENQVKVSTNRSSAPEKHTTIYSFSFYLQKDPYYGDYHWSSYLGESAYTLDFELETFDFEVIIDEDIIEIFALNGELSFTYQLPKADDTFDLTLSFSEPGFSLSSLISQDINLSL